MSFIKKELNEKLDIYIKTHYISDPGYKCAAAEANIVENPCTYVREEKPKQNKFFGRIGLAEKACAAMPAEICDTLQPAKAGKRSLDDVLGDIGMTFSQSLFKHIYNKGLTNAEVYKRAGIDRKLFSKMQCSPDYRPNKKTALALALALELNLDETKDLIARAGYAFSPSSVFDLIIQFFIENEIYDIYAINDALYAHNEPVFP